jgi:aspartate-semialdehyde dehydrogenase
VIEFVDVVGKADKLAPAQIGATCVKVGVTFGFTVMVIVVLVAHNPAVGVNVYVVVDELSKTGDQVPVIEFVDVVGKADKLAPAQIGATCVKVGVTFGFTVMVMFAEVAQSPAVGVNVYVVVDELSKTGDQVPMISLFEIVGSAFKLAPAQIGETCVNVGVTFGFTVMVIVVLVAHNPAVGVNV